MLYCFCEPLILNILYLLMTNDDITSKSCWVLMIIYPVTVYYRSLCFWCFFVLLLIITPDTDTTYSWWCLFMSFYFFRWSSLIIIMILLFNVQNVSLLMLSNFFCLLLLMTSDIVWPWIFFSIVLFFLFLYTIFFFCDTVVHISDTQLIFAIFISSGMYFNK